MEAAIDFKSLRAKFQEGSHLKDRPVVLDRPKRFPPISSRTSSLNISTVESKNSVIPPFNLRDDQKLSGKRPTAATSCFFPPDSNGIGNVFSRRSLKDRHLPLVLPLPSASSAINPKQETCPSSNLVTSPIKCKKKAMPTPFKPAKFSKSIKDILENAEHTESSKSDRNNVENGFRHHNGGSNPGPTFTAPGLPQANGINQRPGPHLHLNGDMKLVQPRAHVPPLVKALPSMGSQPKKPLRPPHVDLSAYKTQEMDNTAENASMILAPGSESVAAENTSTPAPPQFDAPRFLEFASSVLEALNTNEINISALELEPTDVSAPPPGPKKANDGSLHNYGTSFAEQVDAHLQGSSLGHVPEPPLCDAQLQEAVTTEISMIFAQNVLTDSHISTELPSEPSINQWDDHHETCDNVYEEVESISKFNFGQNSRKRKGAPKNPYAESPGVSQVLFMPSVTSEPSTAVWDSKSSVRKERWSPDHHEEKEARKREKQRLEREKKEQKEKEKRENEMKKKFKITGQEEPMYHAQVLLASKPRKHDLQVKSGDTVSIIRTTNCPKGKWLARDSQNKYGYISVMNVELNMKEMLELGKRASQAIGRGHGEADTLSLSSRSSHYNPVLTSSFTDDSGEWTPDDETSSHLTDSIEGDQFSFTDVELLPPPELYADYA
ncbi:FYN-binding protein 1 [Bagarius yarrelli]|uniref:FYN-binding protein 1 n=1 Tax=Bagarius yarrelli TaxID=175774 RepID=A0A556VAX4_BAGYA|nr:FYN-binding protein 1 [Bagarius yarrelli]